MITAIGMRLGIFALAATAAVSAQQKLEFEIASIKPGDRSSDSGYALARTGGDPQLQSPNPDQVRLSCER
jgi:hypothetical protein